MNLKLILIGMTLILQAAILKQALAKSTGTAEGEEPEADDDDGDAKDEKENKKESDGKEKAKPTEEKGKPSPAKEKKLFEFTKCQGHAITTPKPFLKGEETCKTELKAADSNKNGSLCFAVCVWQKMDFLLGEHLKLDSSAVDEFLDALLSPVPETGRSNLKKEWKECKKHIGDEDEDDKRCKRFKPYFACVVAAFDKFCFPAAPVTAPPKNTGGILLQIVG